MPHLNKDRQEAISREVLLLGAEVGPGFESEEAGTRHLAGLGADCHHVISSKNEKNIKKAGDSNVRYTVYLNMRYFFSLTELQFFWQCYCTMRREIIL